MKVQVAEKFVGNGPDSTLGDFDETRVSRVIAAVTPILRKRGDTIADGLTAADLLTNEFVDPAIGLPAVATP
ncbi:hypothetical protein AB0M34_12130 [Nocardia sp. NPDC050193]